MPTTTDERITIYCNDTLPDGSPCSWNAEGPAGKENQIRNMHRARYHGYQSMDPATLRQRAVRQGEAEPMVILPEVQRAAELLAAAIGDGTLVPGQQLTLTKTSQWVSEKIGKEVSPHQVRTILIGLTKRRPPLVVKELGAYYVAGGSVRIKAGGTGRRPSMRTLPILIAEKLGRELGTTYPVGSRLPNAHVLAPRLSVSATTVHRAVRLLQAAQFVDASWSVLAAPSLEAEAQPELKNPEPQPQPALEERSSEKETAVSTNPRPTIREYITGQVLDGTYPPGSVLPSLVKQAQVMNTSWQKIQCVYQDLERQGLIRHRDDKAWEVLEPDHWQIQIQNPLATEAERAVYEVDEEGYPHPVAESDADSTASDAVKFITELIDTERKLLAALRVSWGYEDECKVLRKEVAELRTRPDDTATVNAQKGQISRLDKELRQANEALDRLRGVLHRQEEENAELRGVVHRRKNGGGGIAASFGEFRTTVADRLNMTPQEWERLQRQAAESAKAQG